MSTDPAPQLDLNLTAEPITDDFIHGYDFIDECSLPQTPLTPTHVVGLYDRFGELRHVRVFDVRDGVAHGVIIHVDDHCALSLYAPEHEENLRKTGCEWLTLIAEDCVYANDAISSVVEVFEDVAGRRLGLFKTVAADEDVGDYRFVPADRGDITGYADPLARRPL